MELEERIEALEGFALWLLALVSIAAVLYGAVAPLVDIPRSAEQPQPETVRLGLLVADVITEEGLVSPASSAAHNIGGVLVALVCAVIALATLASIGLVLAMAARGRRLRPGRWLFRLLAVLGAGLLLYVGAAALGSEADVHLGVLLCWEFGLLVAALMYYLPTTRRWWSRGAL